LTRMILDLEKCVGCGNCTTHCPLNLTEVCRGKLNIKDGCTMCGECVSSCGYYVIKIEAVAETVS
jgi:ferredoxin